jgi:fucose 4-O-acetylase-like acetyltransferase
MKLIPGFAEPLSMIRMPLFFFVAGVFFTYKQSISTFIDRKADALLKPYLTVSFTILAISFITEETNIIESIVGILYGNGDTIRIVPLWFLTHLFALTVSAYLLCKLLRFNTLHPSLKTLFILILLSVGLVIINHPELFQISIPKTNLRSNGLPFSIDLVPISLAFFMLGHTLKTYVISLTVNLKHTIVLASIFLTIAHFSTATIGLNERMYIQPVYATIGAACGIHLVLSLSKLIERFSAFAKIPLQLGSSSLFILMFHTTIQNRMSILLTNKTELSAEYSIPLIALLASIALPVFAYHFVNKRPLLSLFFLPRKSALTAPKLSK